MSRAPAARNSFSGFARRASRTAEVALTTMVAWVFGLVCAGVLLYVASGLWRADYATATPLNAADPAIVAVGSLDKAHPWGMTFEGKAGAGIAAVEAAGIVLALGLSMMFATGPRRLGLLGLACWSGLCAVNGAMIVGQAWTGSGFRVAMPVLAGAAALIVVFGCMVHRMFLLWRMRQVPMMV